MQSNYVPDTEMTCLRDHALISMTKPFARRSKGVRDPGEKIFCSVCFQPIVISAGYFRCTDENCDFDACRACGGAQG